MMIYIESPSGSFAFRKAVVNGVSIGPANRQTTLYLKGGRLLITGNHYERIAEWIYDDDDNLHIETSTASFVR